MGDYADDIIEGTCDKSGDYTYKYNVHRSRQYKLTKAERNIERVRKELAMLIRKKISDNPKANPDVLVNDARQEINLKYGRGWRERGLVSNNDNQWKNLNEY